jgi:hypothetical protein
MAQVWQIAGGPSGRSYGDLFLKHGVGLIGPGDAGEWMQGRSDKDFANQPFGERVSDDEMIAHLIVPLFRALGWLPEQVAVEWRDVDVAIFPQLPRKPENCWLIVKAKYPGVGAEGALGQAKRYAEKHNIHRDILVSDGFRYRLYAVEQDYQPVAYANFNRLKRP